VRGFDTFITHDLSPCDVTKEGPQATVELAILNRLFQSVADLSMCVHLLHSTQYETNYPSCRHRAVLEN